MRGGTMSDILDDLQPIANGVIDRWVRDGFGLGIVAGFP